MELRIAKFISLVFHPILMPTLGFYLLFQLNTFMRFTVSPEAKQFIQSVIFLNTAIIPAFIAFFLLWKKQIDSLEMDQRRERWFPFIAGGFFYFFSWILLRQFAFPQAVHSMIFGAAMVVSICTVLNFRWKISIHLAGVGGLVGAVLGISLLLKVDALEYLLLLILLAGFTGFARLKKGAHQPMEIYTGFLLGAITEFCCVFFKMG